MKLPRRKILHLAALAALLPANAGAQGNSLIGTWTSALNPGTPGIIYLTLTIAPNGQLRERLMNRQGVFYDLLGTYQFDPATSTFSFIFTDYSPKQLCSPIGCQPAPVPPGQLNMPGRSLITFPNPNFMIGRATDGTVMNWLRAN
jgi:hypothetical protein